MARKATGTVEELSDGRLQPKITLADGSRMRLDPLPLGTSKRRAKEIAAAKTEQARTRGLVSVSKQRELAIETRAALDAADECAKWVEEWQASRVVSCPRRYMDHWRIYIGEFLGTKSPRHWERDDFRDLSASLDRKVRGGVIKWKTAQNIWETATKMADDSCNSKLRSLRVRDDNPAESVRGPDRGEETVQQFLFPSELVQLLNYSKTPLVWKRLVVINAYTYVRTGELRALNWTDVDLDRKVLSVTKSIGRDTEKLKATKTKCPRLVPIEPTLIPLLASMKKEAVGKDR